MKKRIMAIVAAFAAAAGSTVYAGSFTAVRHTGTNNVYVKGQTEDTSGGDVSITAMSGGNIIYVEQTAPNSNGEFVSKFKCTEVPDDIKVSCNGRQILGEISETSGNHLTGETHIDDEYGTAFITVNGKEQLPQYTYSRTIGGTEYTHTYQSEYYAAAVDLPTAKITVNNVFGDFGAGFKVLIAAYDADGRMIMVKTADKAAGYGHEGEKYTDSFELNEPVPENTAVLKAFSWDCENNFVPLCEYAVNSLKKITLYAVGDSTCAQYGENSFPQAGWGTYIGDYFKTDYVQVVNCGHGGATTGTFLDGSNGNWNDEVYSKLKPGDYVLISLGINDSSRITVNEYGQNLQKMIDMAHEKGAEVIISTPIRAAGPLNVPLRMEEILRTAKKTAQDNGLAFLDIYSRAERENGVQGLREKYGLDNKTLSAPEEDGGFGLSEAEISSHANDLVKSGKNDYTHINVRGANYYSRLMTLELLESNSELRRYIRYTE